MKESRLDRIEKNLAEFLQGMKEERAAIAEQRESQKRRDEEFEKWRESQKEAQKRRDEEFEKWKESRKEAWKKSDEELHELKLLFAKTTKRLDEVGRQLGDLGLVQGEVAEDLFYRNVEYLFDRRKLKFGNIYRNLKKKGMAEYDIVAVNDDKILVIEVKNKLETRMVDRFVNDKLPKFRQAFPEYRDYRLIGGMGALVVKDAVGRYAEKAGLYVLTQNGEGGAMLINPKSFRAKEFL